ncbi:hypothetical protein VV01_21745 [Luteipulveratus halotolerans]|uniref:Uncharacterized protein n=2 Tax=Luteipulveratus halotolerans TaxID=1631356 RepID=A0A0L6CEF7_9MICO|nr:hypothetical protein VV01_21745 [Luteipulveratus halotolerans]
MNGCDTQRFLVRWRAADDVTVSASWFHATAEDVAGEVSRGRRGWMILDGCQVPRMRLDEAANGSTLTDLAVEVQQLEPAV